jgi:hypothetical protein
VEEAKKALASNPDATKIALQGYGFETFVD